MSANPFKRHLSDHLPASRGAMKLANRSLPSAPPDAEAMQAVVCRRLALRLGVTLPVAATLAGLAGLGPREASR